MGSSNLLRELQANNLAQSFNGKSLAEWTTSNLRRAVEVLTEEKILKATDKKFALCSKLLGIQPGPLTHAKQAALRFALEEHGRSLQDARAIARGLGSGFVQSGSASIDDTDQVRTCQICIEDRPKKAFPRAPEGAPICHTEFTTCSECFTAHIESRIKFSNLDEILCPEPDCDAIIDHSLMAKYASAESFRRYEASLNRKLFSGSPGFVSCANELCQNGGDADLRFMSYFTCSECQTRTCTVCLTDWHPNCTHEQNKLNVQRAAAEREEQLKMTEERAGEELRSTNFVKKHTKPCPGENCGAPIEKNDGCDHMTCIRCKFEFCWLCLYDYLPICEEGNHLHANDCDHYRSEDGESDLESEITDDERPQAHNVIDLTSETSEESTDHEDFTGFSDNDEMQEGFVQDLMSWRAEGSELRNADVIDLTSETEEVDMLLGHYGSDIAEDFEPQEDEEMLEEE